MLAANVLVADDDAEARRLFTSTQRAFIDGIFRAPARRAAAADRVDRGLLAAARAAQPMESMLACSFIGSPDTVRAGLEAFVGAPSRTS